MESRLSLYNFLATFVPGTISLSVMIGVFLFAGENPFASFISVGEGVQAIIFISLALLFGEVLHAVGSILEPLYWKSWGGAASTRLLGSENFKDHKDILGVHFEQDNIELIFTEAMALCNREHLGRVEVFNVQYGLARSFLTGFLLVFMVTTLLILFGSNVYEGNLWAGLALEILVFLLFWWRTKKRSEYFVKEVILQASQFIKK